MLTFLLLVRLSYLRPTTVLQRKVIFMISTPHLSPPPPPSPPSLSSPPPTPPSLPPPPLSLGIEKLLEPLRVTIQSRVKANSVKQEFEKQDEMKRSAIRCIIALMAIPDAG